jgi:hypothetical protein
MWGRDAASAFSTQILLSVPLEAWRRGQRKLAGAATLDNYRNMSGRLPAAPPLPAVGDDGKRERTAVEAFEGPVAFEVGVQCLRDLAVAAEA